VTSTAAELIAEAREAVAYLDSFDAHRLTGTPEPTVPARLVERLVQQTIADLADALEVADRALTVDWAENITPEDESAIRRHMHELAVRNTALAAPRLVSTVAELDALPEGTVFRVSDSGHKRVAGLVMIVATAAYTRYRGMNGATYGGSWGEMLLPAAVLWVGGTE
jgi:hypothetical protein